MLTGRIVDSYTNILTVKLFARARDEDAYVREAVDAAHRPVPPLAAAQHAVRLCLSHAQRAAGHRHRRASRSCCGRSGKVEVGTVAMALPLRWQIVNIVRLGRLCRSPTIFENIGVVQEGMMTIARPIALTDPPDAADAQGDARRDRVRGRALRLRPRA